MSNTFTTIPDGIHTIKIETLAMSKTKKGDPMLEWYCVIASGEHAGEHFIKRSVLSTPKAKQFAVSEFQKLGKHIQNSTDLKNHRSEIEGMLVRFNILSDVNGNVAYYVVGPDQPTPQLTTDDDGGDACPIPW